MFSRRKSTGPLLSFLALASALLHACGRTPPEPQPAAPPPTTVGARIVRVDPAPVRTGRIKCDPVKLAAMPDILQVPGRISVNENRTSTIGSIVDGRVVAVFANVGDRVTRGKLVAQLHTRQVHDARSQYTQAVTELRKRQAELEFATNARNRAARLYELKATSLEQLQRAETDLRNAQLGITSAQAEINRIQEQLRQLGVSAEGAEEEYSRPVKAGQYEEDELVPVLSPLDGTVLKRILSPGAVVTPASDLIVISDLSTLWVIADVAEKYLGALKIGRTVDISVQAYPETVFTGRITHIGDSLNPETRTVEVRCETANPQGKLKPEMYATISLEAGEVPGAILVPTAALVDVEGQSTVFVRMDETRFRPQPIRVGRQAGDETQVLEGLKPGDMVVTTGSFLLKSELLKSKMTGE